MKIFVVLLFFVIPVMTLAQQSETKKHPIDIWLDDCLGKQENQSTMGMVQCADNAYAKWDAELNRIYKELLKNLDPDGQKNLKEAQRTWLKVRDEEFKLLGNIYSKKEGSMYIPIQVMDRVEIVKERALQLQKLLDTVTDKRF